MRRLTSQERPCPPPRDRAAKRPAAERRRPTLARRARGRRRFPIGRRAALAGTAAMAVVLVLGTLGWLWSSGWVERQAAALGAGFHRMTAKTGLSVGEVLVEGRARTSRSSLLEALEIDRGDPMLAVDPAAVRRRLEALPWVRRAAVERRLPSLIYLRLEERRPLAVWQLDGHHSVIDEEGEVIPGVRPEEVAALPLVVGPGAPAHSAALLRLLESEPDLMARVTAAVWVKRRRWDLRLDAGVEVQLPEGDPARAWARLARFERRHGVLQRDITAIDLRLPDRLVVRTLSGVALPLKKIEGKNT